MKLLILTPQLPYPPHQGTTIRNFNIIKHLAPRHAITLVSFGTAAELGSAAPLRALCQRIEIAPYPSRSMIARAWTTLASPLPDMGLRLRSNVMRALVDQILREEKFDAVQVEGIEMVRYILNDKSPITNYKIIFDDHNAEYVLQKTAFESDLHLPQRWVAALYSLIQWKKLERYERAICQRADHIVACSNADANAIQSLNAKRPISIIPNGVDPNFFAPTPDAGAEAALVYAGKMDFRPNIDAMTWFCADILPRIRAEIPLAQIAIVGQKPAPRISALKRQPGVQVTGWVADTRPYLADAAVYVVPLRMGSGTRLKVLEALAMGKAIVSTARGVEGIDLVAERDAVIANTPAEFARAVVALLRDPSRRRELGHHARALAEAKYAWQEIIPRFEEIYRR